MVRHSLAEISGKLLVTDPMTARSRRRIDLPQVAIDALHRHREAMAAEGFGQVKWVFCNTRGGPLRRSHFHRQVFNRLLKKANLPDTVGPVSIAPPRTLCPKWSGNEPPDNG